MCIFLSCGVAPEETIILTWDPNSEPDLADYRIYKSNTDGRPYTLLIDVGNVTKVVLDIIDKPNGIIYYVATAYDQENNESDYSIQVFYHIISIPSENL
jgi:hypothetical protein